ncbi:hypothetical protein Vadar_013601 [Vaccinium darrowii]|uniref:Uncharacterized protein n=1 Tax=Vaccinium darrowii TaxID=229202 RepID=A0ACB7ZBK4_9ERIC|nr:hypothetical protein Vadar_013601 [Vaccinium darrowii]
MLGNIRFFFIFWALAILFQQGQSSHANTNPRQGFIETSGTHFVKNGRRLYLNGFNAYWLMYMASDPATKVKVTNTFQQASEEGMNIGRTWAFSDGGYRPLQSSPGTYNLDMFQMIMQKYYSLCDHYFSQFYVTNSML